MFISFCLTASLAVSFSIAWAVICSIAVIAFALTLLTPWDVCSVLICCWTLASSLLTFAIAVAFSSSVASGVALIKPICSFTLFWTAFLASDLIVVVGLISLILLRPLSFASLTCSFDFAIWMLLLASAFASSTFELASAFSSSVASGEVWF